MKKKQKERLVGYQGPVNIKEEYTKTKTGIYGRNSDRVKKNVYVVRQERDIRKTLKVK